MAKRSPIRLKDVGLPVEGVLGRIYGPVKGTIFIGQKKLTRTEGGRAKVDFSDYVTRDRILINQLESLGKNTDVYGIGMYTEDECNRAALAEEISQLAGDNIEKSSKNRFFTAYTIKNSNGSFSGYAMSLPNFNYGTYVVMDVRGPEFGSLYSGFDFIVITNPELVARTKFDSLMIDIKKLNEKRSLASGGVETSTANGYSESVELSDDSDISTIVIETSKSSGEVKSVSVDSNNFVPAGAKRGFLSRMYDAWKSRG